MSSIRKAGVEFYPSVKLRPDLTGLADTLKLKYKIRGTEDDFTDSGIVFTEEGTASYVGSLTLKKDGDYSVVIESSSDKVRDIEGNMLVTKASIDDVKELVDSLVNTLNEVKAKTDVLDEETMNKVSTKVGELGGKIDELSMYLLDTEDDSVTSLLELLKAITEAGSDRDGVITAMTKYSSSSKLMLEGKSYVNSEGETISAEDSFGLAEIYNAVKNISPSEELSDKIDAVKDIVDANKTHLEGLGELKSLVENVSGKITDEVITALSDEENGLIAIRTTIMDKLNSMDKKIDLLSLDSPARLLL